MNPIVGWCQENNSWVRFSFSEDDVKVEVPEYQGREATGWKLATNERTEWYISYTYDDKNDEINNCDMLFFIHNQFLYNFNKVNERYNVSKISSSHGEQSVGFERALKGDKVPFDSSKKYAPDAVTVENDLPPTFERLEIQRKKAVAEEAERKRQAEEERERIKQDWLDYVRGVNLKRDALDSVPMSAFPTESGYTEYVLSELENTTVEFAPENYANATAYLMHLKDIIENPDNYYHEQIQSKATTTYMEDGYTLPLDREKRFKEKKFFYFALLQQEFCTINNKYETGLSVMTLNDLAEKYEQPKILNTTNLKVAVAAAQRNYNQWYNQVAGYETSRGENGFFTWFRHSKRGQANALGFANEVGNCIDVGSITEKVNELLANKTTRYHRHSFASFLLDELKKFEPWQTLQCDKGHYDKNEVISGITNPGTHASLL